jgi:hypothetical protein
MYELAVFEVPIYHYSQATNCMGRAETGRVVESIYQGYDKTR